VNNIPRQTLVAATSRGGPRSFFESMQAAGRYGEILFFRPVLWYLLLVLGERQVLFCLDMFSEIRPNWPNNYSLSEKNIDEQLADMFTNRNPTLPARAPPSPPPPPDPPPLPLPHTRINRHRCCCRIPFWLSSPPYTPTEATADGTPKVAAAAADSNLQASSSEFTLHADTIGHTGVARWRPSKNR
jgi:hypothetical protein